ncbi:MAG: YbaN family protein [Colwellia sp.]|nr:YbaN family protein [Colwellia sp.]
MIYKCIGFFFIGLAILGVALPLLPTTPFVLVAASCFAKSSPRLHQKLLDNKIFGPLIINWETHRIISLRAKFIALSTMFLSVCWSFYMLEQVYLQVMVAVLVLGPSIFIFRLPTVATMPINNNAN